MSASKQVIRAEETVRRPAPVNLATGDESLFQHEYVRVLPAVRTSVLYDITVLPNGFLLAGTHLLSESFGGKPGGMYALRLKASLVKNALRARRGAAIENALFITDEFSNGFFHWVCDVLPRLEAIDSAELRERTLLVPAMADYPYVKESLEAYGKLHIHCMAKSEKARCREILAVSAAAPTGNYRPALMASLRDRFRGHFGVDAGDRKIYISRAVAARRRVANEKDLLPLLQRHGFEIVQAEKLSFAEQVRMAGSAGILVGNHGAGLTNMTWMAAGSKVLELRAEGDSRNNCYYSLAAALGISYHYQLCAPARQGQTTHLADIVVDVAQFEKNLAALA
jgi:capsular polysaccharide biosynthesis protein